MNVTEAAYAEVLKERVRTGEIVGFMFEPVRLRLSRGTHYCPDFLVQMADGTLEFHEVKACMSSGKFLTEDASWIKLKVAAEAYPMFGFFRCGRLPKKSGGGWVIEAVGASA
jgi:hypothetical protein